MLVMLAIQFFLCVFLRYACMSVCSCKCQKLMFHVFFNLSTLYIEVEPLT